jgi:hypothetical protein
MIPDASRCAPDVQAACPALYDELDAIKSLAFSTVLSTLGDLPCGEGLDAAVVLDPVAIGPGNHVIVIPEKIAMERSKNTKSPLLVMARMRTTAVVGLIFEGYPIAEMEMEHVLLPSAEEYDGASKFVTSIGWCVFCAFVDAINAGNLFGGLDQSRDIQITEGQFSDSGGGQATVTFRLSWLSP